MIMHKNVKKERQEMNHANFRFIVVLLGFFVCCLGIGLIPIDIENTHSWSHKYLDDDSSIIKADRPFFRWSEVECVGCVRY